MVKAWPVVVPKGEFKDGNFVVFIIIDSIVPASNSYFSFMSKMKYRVWNARFKGAPSQGLVCPLSILTISSLVMDEFPKMLKFNEGDDVTEILGITHYEKPIDITVGGDAKGGFPTSLISITDEDNLLSYPEALMQLAGCEVYITQKIDGSSSTFTYNNNEFKACSRRLELKEGSGFPWLVVSKYNIKEKLEKYKQNIAIQAECIGPKLNGNRLKLKDLEIRVFRAKDLDTSKLYNYDRLKILCTALELPIVEEVERFMFNPEIHTIEYFQNLANKQMYKTNGKPAEGIVISPTEPFYSTILGKMWSVKIINQNYKQ
jgi:RNA ligase (TIGR02306 family)